MIEDENQILDKKERKKSLYEGSFLKFVIVTLIVVAIISLLGYFGYKYYKVYTNPKTRLVNSLKVYYNSSEIEEKVDKLSKYVNGYTANITGNIKAKINDKNILDNDYNLKLINNKELYYNLILKDDKETIIDLESIIKDQNFYFKFKPMFKRFYYYPYEIATNNITDYSKIYDIVLKTIDEYFTKDKFVSESTTTFIKDSEKRVRKISLKVTESDVVNLYKNLINNIMNDEEALNSLVQEDTTLDDVKKEMNDTLSLFESNGVYSENNYLEYNAYLSGSDILKQEIKMDDYSLVIEGQKDIEYSFKENDVLVFNGTLSNNNLTLKTVDNSLELNINFESSSLNGSININDSSNAIKIEFDLNYELGEAEDIPDLNLSDAKDIDSITDEETSEFIEQLMKLPVFESLSNF